MTPVTSAMATVMVPSWCHINWLFLKFNTQTTEIISRHHFNSLTLLRKCAMKNSILSVKVVSVFNAFNDWATIINNNNVPSVSRFSFLLL
jgi:hypothetical protein